MNTTEFKYMLWENTRKINEEMNAALNTWGSKYELSALQLRILMGVYKNGPQSVGCLANNVAVAGTNISTMCKKLEKLGLLARARDAADERIVHVQLTEAGHVVIKELDQCFERKMLSVLGEDISGELQSIIIAMEKLNRLFSCLDGLRIEQENQAEEKRDNNI